VSRVILVSYHDEARTVPEQCACGVDRRDQAVGQRPLISLESIN
jgi:hypothetical protein